MIHAQRLILLAADRARPDRQRARDARRAVPRRGAATSSRSEPSSCRSPVASPRRTDARRGVTVVPRIRRARARARLAWLRRSAPGVERLARAGSLPRPRRVASPGLADDVADARRRASARRRGARDARLPGAARRRCRRAARGALDDARSRRGRRRVARRASDEAAALRAIARRLRTAVRRARRRPRPSEAPRLASATALTVEHIPNAVELPPRRAAVRHPVPSLLFVGNLTYRPNVEAAARLSRRSCRRASALGRRCGDAGRSPTTRGLVGWPARRRGRRLRPRPHSGLRGRGRRRRAAARRGGDADQAARGLRARRPGRRVTARRGRPRVSSTGAICCSPTMPAQPRPSRRSSATPALADAAGRRGRALVRERYCTDAVTQ